MKTTYKGIKDVTITVPEPLVPLIERLTNDLDIFSLHAALKTTFEWALFDSDIMTAKAETKNYLFMHFDLMNALDDVINRMAKRDECIDKIHHSV